jgi:hypothetical protein
MMPRTADGVLHHKAVDERPAVVCAGRRHGEHLGSATYQQHLVVAASADQLAAVGKIGMRDTLLQIRSSRSTLVLSHCPLLVAQESETPFAVEKPEFLSHSVRIQRQFLATSAITQTNLIGNCEQFL